MSRKEAVQMLVAAFATTLLVILLKESAIWLVFSVCLFFFGFEKVAEKLNKGSETSKLLAAIGTCARTLIAFIGVRLLATYFFSLPLDIWSSKESEQEKSMALILEMLFFLGGAAVAYKLNYGSESAKKRIIIYSFALFLLLSFTEKTSYGQAWKHSLQASFRQAAVSRQLKAASKEWKTISQDTTAQVEKEKKFVSGPNIKAGDEVRITGRVIDELVEVVTTDDKTVWIKGDCLGEQVKKERVAVSKNDGDWEKLVLGQNLRSIGECKVGQTVFYKADGRFYIRQYDGSKKFYDQPAGVEYKFTITEDGAIALGADKEVNFNFVIR